MKKKIFLLGSIAVTTFLVAALVSVIAVYPEPVSWHKFSDLGSNYLGTSGYVDVYGYSDGEYLYAGYVADTDNTKWAIACDYTQSMPPQFEYQAVPIDGCSEDKLTLLMYGLAFEDTWTNPPIGTWNYLEIENWYIYINDTTNIPECTAGNNDEHIVEFKIPLDLIVAECNEEVELFGLYWDDTGATHYSVSIPEPTTTTLPAKEEILIDYGGVNGVGIPGAPGLDKEIPNWNFAQGTYK